MLQRELHQGLIAHAEQGRLEHARQRQVVLRRHQHIEQGHQVQHFAAVDEIGFFADLSGDVQAAQLVLQGHQSGPLARQHHDIGGLQAGACSAGIDAGELLCNPVRSLARLQRAQGFFRQFARGREAVAPCVIRGGFRLACRAWDGRQLADQTRLRGTGGVRAKAFIAIGLGRVTHSGVDGGDDAGGVAPGVVATQQVATQAVAHKGLGRLEHLGFRPAEAVNALLGVAHDEDAGRRGANAATGPTARARVAAEPRPQRLPLQGVGILKLVDQQVFDAGVQALLHPARQDRITQHHQGGTLDVIHVDPAVLALECGKFLEQLAREPRHALLVKPGRMLQARRHHAQHQLLRVAHPRYAGDLFAELARRALLGQQGGEGPRQVPV